MANEGEYGFKCKANQRRLFVTQCIAEQWSSSLQSAVNTKVCVDSKITGYSHGKGVQQKVSEKNPQPFEM